MNYKKVFKRETKVIAMAVICMAIVLIGGSYALFFKVNQNSNNQVVEAGALVIRYDNGNVITVNEDDDSNCLIPMSDEEGAGNSGCKFTLSVHNTGTLPMNYQLLIYDDQASIPSGGTFTNHNYIKHSLSKKVSNKNTSDEANIVINDKKTLGSITELNQDSKKVLETSMINPNETVEFTLKLWIEENAPVDIIGQYVYLKLDVSGEVDDQAQISSVFSDYLVSLAQTSSNIERFEQVATQQTKELVEYRYIGNQPQNYVCLGSEEVCDANHLYRIIGVLPTQNEENENYNRRVKLVKDTGLETQAFGENNNFVTNSLNTTILNGSYLTSLGEYANYIDSALWYLGASSTDEGAATSFNNITPDLLYASERSSSVFSEQPINYVGKIGLMYGSDYAYSIGTRYRTNKIYDNRQVYLENSWLKEGNEWTLSGSSSANEMRYIHSEGYINNGVTTNSMEVRPAFYLKANIKKISGNGTLDQPYRLGL